MDMWRCWRFDAKTRYYQASIPWYWRRYRHWWSNEKIYPIPEFDTYIPPEKDEEHIEDILTEEEIQTLEKKEAKFQERKKKRKKKGREQQKRKRAKERAKKMNS